MKRDVAPIKMTLILERQVVPDVLSQQNLELDGAVLSAVSGLNETEQAGKHAIPERRIGS
jgi:hypothetical protein